MIQINRLNAKDFMQYRELDFSVANGVHSIVGKNRTGKSTLYEAVLWGLYGVTARGMKSVTRRGSSKRGVVMVSGEKDKTPFIVQRAEGGSLKFVVGGSVVEMGTTTLTQNRIEAFLGMNSTLFLGSTLFGHNSFRFTRATDSERKSLLEEILNLDRFNVAREAAFAEASEWEAKLRKTSYDVESHIQSLEKIVEQIAEAEKKEEDDYTHKLKQAIDELADARKEYARYKDVTISTTTLKMDLMAFRNDKAHAQALNDKIKDMEVCPTCKQPLGKEHKQDILKGAQVIIKRAMAMESDLSAQLAKAEQRDQCAEVVKMCEKDLDDVKSSRALPTDSDLVAHLKKERVEVNTNLEKAKRQMKAHQVKLDMYKFWVKAFGRQGVMSLLMDAVVEQLNVYAMESSYGLTDGLLQVQFSTTTTSKTGNVSDKLFLEVLNDGEISPYSALSNSEQQRVDMVVMFAWQKLMQAYAGMEVNVAFFDEIFEGLDEDSMNRVLKHVIDTRSQDPTYIISHVPEASYSPASVIRITRDKDGSHISEA